MKLNENNKNSKESFLQLALVLVLILIQGFLFFHTWVSSYNQTLRFPYVLKGNIFIMLIYMGLSYIFMMLYGCNSLKEYKPMTLFFSETLSIISCNILVYLVVIIPAAALGFMPIRPIILCTIYELVIITLWVIIINEILKKVYPPKELLLISSKPNCDELVYKFINKSNRYVIKDKIVYSNESIKEIYNKCNIFNDILIGDVTSEIRNDIIKHCFNDSRNIYVIPKISDILIKYSDDLLILDTPIFLSSNFGLPFEIKIVKRIIDIIFSLFVLVVFSPIWIFIALLIKIEDFGPVFFIQERVTINKKLFNIYKFRSMKVSKNDDVLPTLDNDDRITKIGKFIRKYHIDEVPQFINVLKGDMSIVGPRPERKEHVELYSKDIVEFDYRYKVKAGLTGLAQIYGKYNTQAIDKLKLDLIYIKKCSIIFDLELIMRTLRVLVIKDNTEGFDVKMQDYIKNNAK